MSAPAHAKRDKGKGRAVNPPTGAEPSLLSNHSSSLPAQDNSYVPPAHQLKKYLHGTKQHMLHKHGKPPKRAQSAADKKLGHHLAHLSSTAQAAATHAFEHDDLLLPTDNAGAMQAETDLERTWRVTQGDILAESAIAAQGSALSLDLPEFGPYALDYTRNGRHLALAGRLGHVATFDALASSLHSELHLRETVRDVKWLHDESFYAVAQKKYVYIYDKQGLEVHQLRQHIEVNRMEFLPFHFLLATVVRFLSFLLVLQEPPRLTPCCAPQGNPGYLKYQDTSTGQLIVEHRTKLGAVDTMAQNPHSAMIHLGHSNGASLMTITRLAVTIAHPGRSRRHRHAVVPLRLSRPGQAPRAHFAPDIDLGRPLDPRAAHGDDVARRKRQDLGHPHVAPSERVRPEEDAEVDGVESEGDACGRVG